MAAAPRAAATAMPTATAELASYAGAFAGVAEEARRGADMCQRLQDSALHSRGQLCRP
ncbi:MAG: hypothetical protein WDM79_04140 [Terricaulis sp.]